MKIIMLTSFVEDKLVQNALEAGAVGYLLKNASINTLADAIRSVYAGQSVLSPEATTALIHTKTGPHQPGKDLSEREREVLALIVHGLSNEEIAEPLGNQSLPRPGTMSAPASRSWAPPIVRKLRRWQPSTTWSPDYPPPGQAASISAVTTKARSHKGHKGH